MERGYADYLGALQRYRVGAMNDPRLLMISSFLVDYPFAERLYPGALDVIAHLRIYELHVGGFTSNPHPGIKDTEQGEPL